MTSRAPVAPGMHHTIRAFWATGIVRFTTSSGAGLLVDLGVFALLLRLGLEGFFANVISTLLAISLVYVLVTRLAFGASRTWRTYAAFIGWYGASALLVSAVIQLVSAGDEVVAAVVKLASVPVTFSTNYFFGRWLFGGGAERRSTRYSSSPSELGSRLVEVGGERLLQRAFFRRWRWRMAGLVALVFVVLVVPLNLAINFQQPSDWKAVGISHLLQIGFAGALLGAAVFVIRFGQAVRLRSRRHRNWLKLALGYLLVNVVVLSLIYPGYWVWDEFGTVAVARQFSTSAWQGYLTTVFYSLALLLGPSPMMILVVQLLVLATVVGYLGSLLMQCLNRRWLVLLLAVPLLSLPVLLNNQYPLRLTLYAYLLALLLARIAVLRARHVAGLTVGGAFLGVVALVAILAFWRSEGIVLLALIPLAFVLAGLHRQVMRRKTQVVGLVGGAAVMVLVSAGATAAGDGGGYQASAVINPLSTMLQSDLVGPSTREDLRVIDNVLDLQVVRASPSWLESPALWAGALKGGFTGATPGLLPAFADVVLHNPGPFIDNRAHAYLAANSMQRDWVPQVQIQGVINPSSDARRAFEGFQDSGAALNPLSVPLKYSVESAMLLLDHNGANTLPGALIWNSAPLLVLVLVLVLWALWTRRTSWALAGGVVLVNALLVFLTEPAAYFMYFFPAYLVSGLLLASALALALDKALPGGPGHMAGIAQRRAQRSKDALEGQVSVRPRPFRAPGGMPSMKDRSSPRLNIGVARAPRTTRFKRQKTKT